MDALSDWRRPRVVPLVVAFAVAVGLTACNDATPPLGPEDGASPSQPGILFDHTPGTSGPNTVDLLAGQDTDVGDVTLTDDGTDLTIQIIMEGGWCLAEVHIAAADDEPDLPQNRSGNPQPGRFDKAGPGDPWTGTSDELDCSSGESYTLPLPPTDDGGIVVAVHTVVLGPEQTMWVYSDGAESFTAYTGPGTGEQPAECTSTPGSPRSGTAVAAWQHPSWIANVNPLFSHATWVWESYRVLHPVCGDVVDFEKTFAVPGVPTGGSLRMTVDNGYEASLNEAPLGSDGVSGAWRTSDLTEGFVTTAMAAWSSVESYDLLPALVTGENTFTFLTANEYMWPNDGSNPQGTVDNNPGGLIYEATITYRESETAWADGTEFPFDGKGRAKGGGNWGMYVDYTYCVIDVYNGSFEMPEIASSFGWHVFPSSQTGWTTEWVGSATSFGGLTRPTAALLEIQENLLITADDGDQYAELDSDWDGPAGGVTGEPASIRISQRVCTTPGEEYTLSYAWATRTGDDVLLVGFGGSSDTHTGGGAPFQGGWHEQTLGFTATGPSALVTFEDPASGDGNNSFGMLLDDVSVSP